MRLRAPLVMPITAGDEGFGCTEVASHSCVRWPRRRSSGALGPPILVGTQPGSTELVITSGQRRAIAAASVVTKSLLSEYEADARFPSNPTPEDRGARPYACCCSSTPVRPGLATSAVSTYGATTFTGSTSRARVHAGVMDNGVETGRFDSLAQRHFGSVPDPTDRRRLQAAPRSSRSRTASSLCCDRACTTT